MELSGSRGPLEWLTGSNHATAITRGVLFYVLVLLSAFLLAQPAFAAKAEVSKADKKCVMCHQRLSFKKPPAAGEERQVHIKADEFLQESHTQLGCRNCHQDILKTPHRKDVERGVDCVSCHRRHPEFVLRDAAGSSVLDSGEPLSTMQTCGHCHDTDFVESYSDHADAGAAMLYENGRPQPWEAGPGYFGGWDPIRYDADVLNADGSVNPEAWLKRYGKHHVGGGPVGEFIEMNCLMCHSDIMDQSARADAMGHGEFAWANSLPLSEREILQFVDGQWQWNPEAFSENGKLRIGKLDIGTPTTEKCAMCHGEASSDAETPLELSAEPHDRRFTERTGQLVAPHPVGASGLNIVVPESQDHPLDIHAGRGMDCTQCHNSLNNPVYYRDNSDSNPAHLVYDPRRPVQSDYLDQPLHQFAKGRAIHGLASEESAGSVRSCEACHNAFEAHDWLPYQQRHFQSVACETCHIPKIYGPALQAIDWTMLDAAGEPIRQYRGVDVDPTSEEAAFEGYEPVLLPRQQEDGSYRLAPFNAVTSWFWLSGEPPRPVSREELAGALLAENGHHPDVIAGLDQDGDGQLAGDELRLVTAEQQDVVRRRLAESGLAPLTVETEIMPFPISHNVVTDEWAISECSACHHEDSILRAVFPLSAYLPGGQPPSSSGYASVALQGELVDMNGGGIGGVADASQSGFYVIGLDSVPWVDLLGLLIFLGVCAGVSLHGLARFIANRRNPHPHPALKRVYMYDMYDRIWHWLQALSILVLLFTGLVIHKPHLFGMFNFSWMVDVHNILGIILIINAALALFYTVASGTIKRFLPDPDGFFGRAFAQSMYYTKGIFAGDLHPLEKTKDNRLNPLQQVTYLAILNVLLPLQVITGLMLYWGSQNWPIYFTALGGLPFLAPAHTFIAWVFAAFIVMHVYLTTAGGHTPLAGIKSMITGWDDVEQRPEKAVQFEEEARSEAP